MAAKRQSSNLIMGEAEIIQSLYTSFKLDEIVFSCVINNPSLIVDHVITPIRKQKRVKGPKPV
jgi:hypothetical protein